MSSVSKMSYLDYFDLSGLDKLIIKSWTDLLRDTSNVALLSSNGNIGSKMLRKLLMNTYDITNGKQISTSNNITVGNDI